MSLTVKQTGSFKHTYTMTNASCVAIDLTGFTVTATAKLQRRKNVTQAFTVVEEDLANGIVSINLTPTETAGMSVSQWDVDVKMVSADTLTVYFTPTETLEVKENVT